MAEGSQREGLLVLGGLGLLGLLLLGRRPAAPAPAARPVPVQPWPAIPPAAVSRPIPVAAPPTRMVAAPTPAPPLALRILAPPVPAPSPLPAPVAGLNRYACREGWQRTIIELWPDFDRAAACAKAQCGRDVALLPTQGGMGLVVFTNPCPA